MHFSVLLVEAYGHTGQCEEGLRLLAEADIEVARQQQVKSPELRTVISLARLRQLQTVAYSSTCALQYGAGAVFIDS